MNIIVAIIFGLKRAPECIKMHYFEGEHAKIFLERGTAPHPTPVGASIRVDPSTPHFWIRACSLVLLVTLRYAFSALFVPLLCEKASL